MESKDLRVRRTYKLLRDSLVELIQQKPFDKISVKDICENAMVHRATFYSHFEDKYHLLNYCVWGFFSEFDKIPVTDHTLAGYRKYFMNVARRILQHMEENSNVYMAFLKQNSASFGHILSQNIYEKLCSKYRSCASQGFNINIPEEIFASFYAGACSNMVIWWLQNNMPVSSDELVNYLDKMVMHI